MAGGARPAPQATGGGRLSLPRRLEHQRNRRGAERHPRDREDAPASRSGPTRQATRRKRSRRDAMSLEERLRQAGSAVEAQVAARIDTAKLLADLRRREQVASLCPVAVGVGASTGSIAAPGEMVEFARAVVGGDPIAVARFERDVLRPIEPQSNATLQGKRGDNVSFAHELRRRLAALRVLSEAIEIRESEAAVDRLVHMLVQELYDLRQLESAMLGSPRRDALDDVEVLVADRGPGLGRAPDRRLAGGVGLQLVRQFAQEAGGRLWSRDREGGGALFGLWLPAGRLTIAGA